MWGECFGQIDLAGFLIKLNFTRKCRDESRRFGGLANVWSSKENLCHDLKYSRSQFSQGFPGLSVPAPGLEDFCKA